MDTLPDLEPVIEEKKLTLKKILSVLLLLFLLLSIPVGVYLAQHPQLISSNASNQIQVNPETSVLLKQRPSADKTKIVLDIYLKSDFDPINLSSLRLTFPKDNLLVEKIEDNQDLSKDNLVIKKNIEQKFNNDNGLINLITGFPAPGRKTDAFKNEALYLTSINFVIKQITTDMIVKVDPSSWMLKNTDNKNILFKRSSLNLDTKELTLSKDLPKQAPAPQSLYLKSPVGGQVFSYQNPIEINWDDNKDLSQITISLLVNDQNLGKIATNINDTTKYSWIPANNLPLGFVNSSNTFRFNLEGKNKKGEAITLVSKGPIGITLDSKFLEGKQIRTQLDSVTADLNGDSKIDATDLSILLANYLTLKTQNPKTDLNQDGIVNDLDLYLLLNQLTLAP